MRRREDEDVACADLVKHLQALLGHSIISSRNASAFKGQLDANADSEPAEEALGHRRRRK